MPEIPPNMPLTSLLQTWLDAQPWFGEIELDADERSALLSTDYVLDEQQYRASITVHELTEWLGFALFTPYLVPTERMPELLKLLNGINLRVSVGAR